MPLMKQIKISKTKIEEISDKTKNMEKILENWLKQFSEDRATAVKGGSLSLGLALEKW